MTPWPRPALTLLAVTLLLTGCGGGQGTTQTRQSHATHPGQTTLVAASAATLHLTGGPTRGRLSTPLPAGTQTLTYLWRCWDRRRGARFAVAQVVQRKIPRRPRVLPPDISTVRGDPWSGVLGDDGTGSASSTRLRITARGCRWALTVVPDGPAEVRYTNAYFGLSFTYDASVTNVGVGPLRSRATSAAAASPAIIAEVQTPWSGASAPTRVADAVAAFLLLRADRLAHPASASDVARVAAHVRPAGLAPEGRPVRTSLGGVDGVRFEYVGRVRPLAGRPTTVAVRYVLWVLTSGERLYVVAAEGPRAEWDAFWTNAYRFLQNLHLG